MLRSDVPVGAYVSGGIDSTVIAALVRRYTDQPLDTFSVTFEDPEYDESALPAGRWSTTWASASTDRCTARARTSARVFPDVVWHTEQPIVRTAPAPLFLLSRLVRENGYKVVLTGEGSDEVLGGVRHLQGSQGPPLLGARTGLAPAAARCCKRLYPYMTSLQSQPPAYLRAFFHVRAGGPRRVRSSRTCRAGS